MQGNFIGTKINGTQLLGNANDGVFVTVSTNNTFGGTAAGAGNVIAGNGANGIGLGTGALVAGLAIKGNSIFSNGGLGIDVEENGLTFNDLGDADTGDNNLQNFPVRLSRLHQRHNQRQRQRLF